MRRQEVLELLSAVAVLGEGASLMCATHVVETMDQFEGGSPQGEGRDVA